MLGECGDEEVLTDEWEIVAPSASPIFEALRAFGYSPETAVADLVDNSISANAGNIYVSFQWNAGQAYVVIKDDGIGMDSEQLTAAMRLGSRSPLEERALGDLGRFGLGMKTASISQAREVTVISVNAPGGDRIIRRWDLDEVRESGEWRLRHSPPDQDLVEVDFSVTGTAVIWTKCDRLVGTKSSNTVLSKTQFFSVAESVGRHLSLTFHRFLSKKNGLKIYLNGARLKPWDPFMADHLATWSPGQEQVPFKSAHIGVTPYVLPHKSKLTEEQHREAAAYGGWNASQGFYVYRDDRLLVAGSWLGLGGAKEEHSKLARIALDVPVEFDNYWQVDVMKSQVRPPGSLVKDLQTIARATKSKAQGVYRFRGKINAHRGAQDFVHSWQQFKDRNGSLSFKINRSNPMVVEALAVSSEAGVAIERLLRWVEETVPVTQIAIQVADGVESTHVPFGENSIEVRALLDFLFVRMNRHGGDPFVILDKLAATDPFSHHPGIVAEYRERLE